MTYYEKHDLDELRHFGVKGMRWGVRRNTSKDAKNSNAKPTRSRSQNLRKVAYATAATAFLVGGVLYGREHHVDAHIQAVGQQLYRNIKYGRPDYEAQARAASSEFLKSMGIE